MSSLGKAVRQKRFVVRGDADLRLCIETGTGARLEFPMVNCSLHGLGAIHQGPFATVADDLAQDLVPAAKITFAGQEVFLGRMILRRTEDRGTSQLLGFQTIDAKVPVDGVLSRYLDADSGEPGAAYSYELDPERFTLASFAEADQPNVDLFTRCKQFSMMYKLWRQSPKYQYRTVREPSMGTRVNLRMRRRDGRSDFIIMGSNDYLGLASHPKVLEAAKSAIDRYGFGSTGSPVTTGTTAEHEELCTLLARMFRKEKAILYNSGYTANIGIINGLTAANDLVVADVLAHASIQDAMRMSRATSRFFRHNDCAHLDTLLKSDRPSANGALVVTEGVFSMDGDVARLPEICRVARAHNARVMLDEAHAFGVLGRTGMGTCELHSCFDEVDVVMGTFSKIAGGIGGFAAASEEVIEWLYHLSRAHLFTVSLPPSTVAAARAALTIFMETPQLVTDLHRNIRHFTNGLRQLGARLAADHASAVIPLVIGDERKLGEMNVIFRDSGVFVVPVVYPAVSRRASRFRFTVMATHTISDLDFVLGVVERALEKTGVRLGASEPSLSLVGPQAA